MNMNKHDEERNKPDKMRTITMRFDFRIWNNTMRRTEIETTRWEPKVWNFANEIRFHS